MIKRHLEQILKKAANQYPVISLTGPRQSGKTTLAKSVFSKWDYVTLESPDHRAFAIEDPRGFLAQFADSVILDEVQRVPDLFSYIQGIVDEHDKPGQFLLTGSQNFLLQKNIGQSLAGRCAILHLLPFTRSELKGKKRLDISRIIPSRTSKSTETDDLFKMLFKGFYPRIHDKNLEPQNWLANYYQTYIERDVRDILNVGDIETFGRFLRLCAGRSGQLLNVSSLASDCGISHTTANRWLSILQTSFLIYLLQPHHQNFNKRLIKSPKLYFWDTGLLCYLLRIRDSEDLKIHAARGPLFENWVIVELLKNYCHNGLEPDIYFWRDSAGHEIDLVIDQGNELIPIEIKSGETIGSDFFKGLAYWKTLSGQKNGRAALIYGGPKSYVRNNVSVTSWTHWG